MSCRFTKDRLSQAGHRAARRAQAEHIDLNFNCDFKGINDEQGNVEPIVRIAATDQAAFEWRVRGGGVDETCVVTVRCDKACVRGVRLPDSWAQYRSNEWILVILLGPLRSR